MTTSFNLGVGLCFAFCIDCGAADIKVQADINDHLAPRSPIRSFDATTITIGELQKKAGNLKNHQVVAIWCEGTGMGAAGVSAFDVLHGSQIDSSVKKLGATTSMALVQLCKAQQADFERKRR